MRMTSVIRFLLQSNFKFQILDGGAEAIKIERMFCSKEDA